jgi:hypothetical protein
MSKYKFEKLNQQYQQEKTASPSDGKSFLELLINESNLKTGNFELNDLLYDEPIGEIAIPNRNKKKRLKFLRFSKLKEMLDNFSQTEPEKTDGYVIMNAETSLSPRELKEIEEKASDNKVNDTEEFLNSISDKLRHFGNVGRKQKQTGENLAALAEDEAAFEAGIIKSITQDEEIVSETLADLLVYQGQYSKAVKMYNFLISKFPEKGAYFAKKIKKIKK